MPSFKIPTPLRHYANGETTIEVAGTTVAEALASLTTSHPDLRNHLYNGENLRNFINIYYNQEDIRYLDGTQTAIAADAVLLVVPSIAGG